MKKKFVTIQITKQYLSVKSNVIHTFMKMNNLADHLVVSFFFHSEVLHIAKTASKKNDHFAIVEISFLVCCIWAQKKQIIILRNNINYTTSRRTGCHMVSQSIHKNDTKTQLLKPFVALSENGMCKQISVISYHPSSVAVAKIIRGLKFRGWNKWTRINLKIVSSLSLCSSINST